MLNKNITFYLFFVTLLALLLNLGISVYIFEFQSFLAMFHIPASWFISVILLIAILGAFGSLLFSALIVRFMLGVTLIREPSTYLERWLFTSVKRQSNQLGIDTPQIGVFYASDLNAFTTGWRQRNAMFAVSSGLLETLDQEELEAVIGHELAHIENGDIATMAIAQGLVVTLTTLPARMSGLIIDAFIFRRAKEGGLAYMVTYWICMILMGLLPHFVVMWFSRQREFSADKTSVLLNGGDKMILALNRLAKTSSHLLFSRQSYVLGIAGGVLEGLVGREGIIKNIFSSHPPLKNRINAIQKYINE